MFFRCFVSILFVFSAIAVQAAPNNFSHAKVLAKEKVYFDQTDVGTFYCGCQYEFTGRSGGRINLESCGYEVRKNETRAQRLEWEHIVPASNFGRARQCWQEGGRKNCVRNDPVFAVMEADMHNLTPSIGEINGDRSNFNFSQFNQRSSFYGQCDFKVDFKNRLAEPRNEVKGQIARVYFYMFDRYGLNMSTAQQQILMLWDKTYPVSAWERERDERIAKQMGHSNPFVTGERTWTLGHKNSREGMMDAYSANSVPVNLDASFVRGNKRSKVYHLPEGCPSYNQISENNIALFSSELTAIEAGYRKAGNCRN
ncbi:deoxyribonuclease I [Vibrio astriarenae]|uniref:Deoxyribonuclease I n=1 Tax=Vibrio astriarenae TaxID=1481923 RepID=A0A7Z2T2L9_9VIBR|nr:endonuclease [Vibrio astriarenae]QIA63147.1 deoxyribonuclease I [Vibrio astriarenae]